jgi:membrane protease YdiL (CAAX protease family)
MKRCAAQNGLEVGSHLGVIRISHRMPVELKCSGCGESNPRGFDLCWNCGNSLTDAERVVTADEPDDAGEEFSAIETGVAISTQAQDYRWVTLCEVVAVVLVTCVSPLLVRAYFGKDQPAEASVSSALVWIPWNAGMSGILWFLIRRDPSVPQPQPLVLRMLWLEAILGFLIFSGDWSLKLIVGGIANLVGIKATGEPLPILYADFGLLAAHCVDYFFAAMYEELLFRVYLPTKLRPLLGNSAAAAIAASALLFTILHGYGWHSSLVLFAGAVFFGLLYHYSRAVPRLVLAHWLHNIVIFMRHSRLIVH